MQHFQFATVFIAVLLW